MSKPRIFSGMRPTGRLHLGNLLGALDNWVRLQDEYDCVFAVVDWHALTTGYEDTGEIQENTRNMVIDYLSAGIDPEKSLVIKQSDVKQHAELSLLLSMITPLSWLERCPTYKEQLRELEGREIMTHGFLGYPVLMAADILVYKAKVVPVGEDQLPHIELAREIARRFNFLYQPVFPEPQERLNEVVLLPGTDGRKMSKSYRNIIEISASAEEVKSIVANMVTDPQRIRRRDPGNPDVCSVYAFHGVFSKLGIEDIREGCRSAGIGCVDCKRKLADALNEYLEPIRKRREAILKNPGIIDEVLEQGAKKAAVIAESTLSEVRQAMRI
ncbi:MAG TPA: tryptophan--tRNA ligase [Firmicutes bacterium]|jgi:tryptophanyl-tRNA synthetase|nr:tryptophan--tRNA ligase [Bacillota bacterium]